MHANKFDINRPLLKFHENATNNFLNFVKTLAYFDQHCDEDKVKLKCLMTGPMAVAHWCNTRLNIL